MNETHDFAATLGPPLDGLRAILTDTEAATGHTWEQRIDELLALRTLEDDWDGQGAEAPDPALVDGAIKLAVFLRQKNVPPALRALAGLAGTVSLEWQSGRGYAELEVLSPSEAEYRWLPEGASRAEVVRVVYDAAASSSSAHSRANSPSGLPPIAFR